MLENDIFVRHRVCGVNSVRDIPGYVNRSFDSNIIDVKDAILALASYCVFISYEELYGTFPLNSTRIDTTAVPSLIKAGFLKKCPLSGQRSTTRTYFRITPSGFDAAMECLWGENPNKYKKEKNIDKGRGFDRFADHIYFSGYNLFSILSFRFPIVWRREFPYTHGRGYAGGRNKGDLIVDARCGFFPDDPERYRLAYIEEDTGSEPVYVLLDKLHKYHKYRLMEYRQDMVVFSFFESRAASQTNSPEMKVTAYSTSRCKELYYYMKRYSVSDAATLVGNREVDQEYLKAVMLVTGAAKEIGGGKIAKGSFRLSEGAMKEFYESLRFRRNPYQHREFNLRHAALAFRRMSGMAAQILSDPGSLPLYAREMAHGFPVYCIATTLMSERLPYGMLSDFPEEQEEIKKTLSSYFADVEFSGELGKPVTVSPNGDYIRPRNAFSYSYGMGKTGTAAVEFMSFDLGAWVRALLFAHYARSEPDNAASVQLICVFDTAEHVRRFFKMLKKLPMRDTLVLDRPWIYALMMKDLGEPQKVFALYGKDNTEKAVIKEASLPYRN